MLKTHDSPALRLISLQPRGLAETLCGSPLYMAPEIMQLQKYDAKADLWSVGAILFQLVTGRTPFTGNNQIQLLQNIMKSTELQFPSDSPSLSFECKDLCQKLLRRNPVERLTFEEFFNHPFLSQKQREQVDEPLRSRSSSRLVGGFFPTVSDPLNTTEENYQEDCLPFILDDDPSGPEGSPSFSRKKSSIKSTYGFDLNSKLDKPESASPMSNNINSNSGFGSITQSSENTARRLDNHKISRNVTDPLGSPERMIASSYPKGNTKYFFGSHFCFHSWDSGYSYSILCIMLVKCMTVTDSLENIDQEYVLVPGPPIDISSSLVCTSRPSHTPYRSGSLPQESSSTLSRPSAPMPIVGVPTNSTYQIGSSGSQDSAPGTSLGSMDTGDEQPSAHCMTRVKSLQQCASAITELVNEKMEAGKHLEAFSIQLVILAIWKQALHICHTQAASAMEGSPSQETSRYRRSASRKVGSPDSEECLEGNTLGPKDILSKIESEFLREFEHAEELAKTVEPGNTEMPDAMETIFQSALAFGRHGGVEELMGDMESAAALYSKAVRLLVFLLVEGPSLILNPPFSLTNSDRYRLRNYIDILNNRQGFSRSQRMTLLKCDESQGILKEKI
ncbi:unnamed protein product [Sphenostylis stenocarpa]|uniref:Protein kinase domain-containing protein n=1 Tax=Sphenostylis stenocarpa TaxID=92480 RepID=A0AA86SLC4_9FABA|nr:unnamed protein product [Sphenostylis stenocarpa]